MRFDNIFIRLLYNLFPDLYIHGITVEFDSTSGERKITIFFLTFRERGLAIGRGADYIRSVIKLLKKYIIFENEYTPIEIEYRNLII